MKRYMILVLVLSLACGMGSPAAASSDESSEIAALRREIARLEAKLADVTTRLQQMERRLTRIERSGSLLEPALPMKANGKRTIRINELHRPQGKLRFPIEVERGMIHEGQIKRRDPLPRVLPLETPMR